MHLQGNQQSGKQVFEEATTANYPKPSHCLLETDAADLLVYNGILGNILLLIPAGISTWAKQQACWPPYQ